MQIHDKTYTSQAAGKNIAIHAAMCSIINSFNCYCMPPAEGRREEFQCVCVRSFVTVPDPSRIPT